MRRVTAERMAHAKQTVPHFYLEIDCAADRLLARRDAATAGGDALTVTDVIVRATALALVEVPLANSAWTGEAVRVYETADIAVAVTTPTGLVAPVVRAAGGKQLRAIATELRDLVERARSGRLAPPEYSDATFTVSNLGMHGVSSLFAIVNPPQSCILGVGAVESRPVARDGTVVVAAMMTLTLSADHRAIDGATGAEFLRALRRLLEHPDAVFA
jgi:pyruvate dehydrogenase E2 component (dihydrolipoamide acetyltransferase)